MTPDHLLTHLTDIEDCAALAIKAHDVERFDHVLHYIKVIHKTIRDINVEFEGMQEGHGDMAGCNYSARKPNLDEYDMEQWMG